MKLYYTHNLQPRVTVAMAKYLKSPVEFIRIDPMGADKESYREINPNTLAPTLVEDDGRILWETDAIICRLSRLAGSDLWPMDQLEEVIRWLSWSAHHFTRAGSTPYFWKVVAPTFTSDQGNPQEMAEAYSDFRRFGQILDDTLASRDWLVGNKLSYADFRVATTLPFADKAELPLSEFRHVQAWHNRMLEIDAWRDPFAGLA